MGNRHVKKIHQTFRHNVRKEKNGSGCEVVEKGIKVGLKHHL